MKLVLTCEHGGNQLPAFYGHCFAGNEAVLSTHRGYDPGALDVFKSLEPLSAFSYHSLTSRLLVELNRSLHHKDLFSPFSKKLSPSDKKQILKDHYSPYRTAVENTIKQLIEANETVLHVSVHTFTPVLNNKERSCDIGLLYDPAVVQEKSFARQLKPALHQIAPALHLRFNYPYLGKMDGFTTYLRKCFNTNYLGLELEINQKFSENNSMEPLIKDCLYTAIKNSL